MPVTHCWVTLALEWRHKHNTVKGTWNCLEDCVWTKIKRWVLRTAALWGRKLSAGQMCPTPTFQTFHFKHLFTKNAEVFWLTKFKVTNQPILSKNKHILWTGTWWEKRPSKLWQGLTSMCPSVSTTCFIVLTHKWVWRWDIIDINGKKTLFWPKSPRSYSGPTCTRKSPSLMFSQMVIYDLRFSHTIVKFQGIFYFAYFSSCLQCYEGHNWLYHNPFTCRPPSPATASRYLEGFSEKDFHSGKGQI